MYITTDEELVDFCEQIRHFDILALDTEFVREKTYFHRLGLIQVACKEHCAVIDPILLSHLDPFLNLIKNPNVLKVFHAGKQDLEILHRLCGEVVKPVFDTQVAASLIGWGLQISFAKIVQKVTGKKIDKSETYTDWCYRPLRPSQIEYALDDARYLLPVYEKIIVVLKKAKRLDWVRGEFEVLEDPEKYQLPDADKQFLKLKNIRVLKPRNLAVIRELAAWRELEARKRDCLPKAVMRDEPLFEIARTLPKKSQQLAMIRGFHRKEMSKSGPQIFEAIEKGLAVPKDQIPVLPDFDGYSTRRGVEEVLAAYVQIRAEELRIEPSVLADRKQIRDFIKSYELKENIEEHFLFQKWRKECIGTALYSILDGKMGLGIGPSGKVFLIPSTKN